MRNLFKSLAVKAVLATSFFVAAVSYAATTPVIDVLVVYTPGTAVAYSGDPSTRINQLFATTNQIYKDSGVNFQIRLAGTMQVTYTDDNTADQALNDITNGAAGFGGVAAKRTAVGADMVILYRPYKSVQGSCGLAWVGGQFNNPASVKGLMYSHIAINSCPDMVTAHELGHNMGLKHSHRQDPNGGAAYSYGYGYGIDGQFVTVMAYASSFGVNAWTDTMYKFSNPALTCKGVPCGISSSDTVNGADAHAAINLSGPLIADFYPTGASVQAAEAVTTAEAAMNAAKAVVDADKAAVDASKAQVAALAANDVAAKALLASATVTLKKVTANLKTTTAKKSALDKAITSLTAKRDAAQTAYAASTDKTRATTKTKLDAAQAALDAKSAELVAFTDQAYDQWSALRDQLWGQRTPVIQQAQSLEQLLHDMSSMAVDIQWMQIDHDIMHFDIFWGPMNQITPVSVADFGVTTQTKILAIVQSVYDAAKAATAAEKANGVTLKAKLATDTATYNAAVKAYKAAVATAAKTPK